MQITINAPLEGVPQLVEGVRFQADASGYLLIYSYRNPTDDEIAQFRQGEPFQIAFLRKGGALWLLSRVGSLAWTDAPFHPGLAPHWTPQSIEHETEGTALTLVLTDSPAPIVRAVRLIGLGHDFSVRLLDAIAELSGEPWDAQTYAAGISATMRAYKTEHLLAMCPDRNKWRLKGEAHYE